MVWNIVRYKEHKETQDYTMPLIGGFIAVIIAVAIVGIFMVKKK